jgi:sulfur carrier protein
MTMVVKLNGETRQVPVGTTVANLLELLERDDGRGVAVAVDSHVVPRSAWTTTELADGAQVEVVGAVQGG